MLAVAYMLAQTEERGRVSPEAVGAAKVLKVAIRLKQFEEELKEKGEKDYKITDQYSYIRDILEA